MYAETDNWFMYYNTVHVQYNIIIIAVIYP